METKVCKQCGTEQPLSNYHKSKSKKFGVRCECKSCVAVYQKARREGPKREKLLEEKRKYQKEHPDVAWRSVLKRHGITEQDYWVMHKAQGGRCAICGREESGSRAHRRLVVDHDHATGKVRGLLCSYCNSGLGHFKDSVQFMENAIHYLLTR